jgi:hypothetical protein
MDSLRECSGGGSSSSRSSSSSGKNKEQWNVLLITDTNFPGGALANSIGGTKFSLPQRYCFNQGIDMYVGLESAMNHGFTNGSSELQRYVVMSLENMVHSVVPFVLAAHSCTYDEVNDIPIGKGKQDFTHRDRLLALNQQHHAMLASEVARRASITQGLWSLFSSLRLLRLMCLSALAQGLALFDR